MDGSGEILGIMENKDGIQKGKKEQSVVCVLPPALQPLLAHSHTVWCNSNPQVPRKWARAFQGE